MPIKYDEDKIKRPEAEHEYTPEQVQALYDCSQSLENFLPYVTILNPDQGRIQYQPYDFQKEFLQEIEKNRFTVAMCGRQLGKCVFQQSQIVIRNKRTGEIKEIPISEFYEML